MTYNIRYLALYIGSLKFCNVRYLLSYKHLIWNFTPETQLSKAFYYRVAKDCSMMV